MVDKIGEIYYWLSMRENIEKFVIYSRNIRSPAIIQCNFKISRCEVCQQQEKGLLKITVSAIFSFVFHVQVNDYMHEMIQTEHFFTQPNHLRANGTTERADRLILLYGN